MCSMKLDTYGLTYIEHVRVWFSPALLGVFSSDLPWNRILESIRLCDRENLWTNPDAQWDQLVEPGWMGKWIQVHGRPMIWEKGAFSSAGLPVPREPAESDSRKWIQRGSADTTRDWLYRSPAEIPDFTPESSASQRPATPGVAASSSEREGVVVTPVDPSVLGVSSNRHLRPWSLLPRNLEECPLERQSHQHSSPSSHDCG